MNLFNAFYNSFYGLACIVLFGLLLITPSDTIRQALSNNQLYNVFVIAGAFVLTLILVILIISQRLYTNTSVLKAIPKTWIPVEKGDVNKKVRRMIVASLTRSAIIAWEARPHIPGPLQAPAVFSGSGPQGPVLQPGTSNPVQKEKEGRLRRARSQVERDEQVVAVPAQPEWEDIAHKGWSSPASPDLPNLQYSTVILELPHLIEARAVSLAPPDPQSTTDPPSPDIRVVDVLQRPAAMGLREYLGYLTTVGVISFSPATTDFLVSYEHARFSEQPLNDSEFRVLMAQFADLLRTMHGLSPVVLANLNIEPLESDTDDDSSTTSSPTTSRSVSLTSLHTSSTRSGSEGTIRTAPSRNTRGTPTKRVEKFSTAPATPRSKKRLVTKSPSSSTFAQSRQPYTTTSGSSSSSLRSTSQSSVIKLSRSAIDGDLPYTITVPGIK